VDGLYVIFEMIQMLEDQPSGLAHGVATRDCRLRFDSSQVSPFDVIPHLRNAAKGTHPRLITLRFVADTDRALSLGKDEGERLRIG
jgi:hypothetical protein